MLEFKYAQNENEEKFKLDEAVAQIKARVYGNILPLRKETLKIAAVFIAEPSVRCVYSFLYCINRQHTLPKSKLYPQVLPYHRYQDLVYLLFPAPFFYEHHLTLCFVLFHIHNVCLFSDLLLLPFEPYL